MAWRVMSSCALAVSASASSGNVVDSALASSEVTLCSTAASGRGRWPPTAPVSPGAGPSLGSRGSPRSCASVATATATACTRATLGSADAVAGPGHGTAHGAPAAAGDTSAPKASSCWRQRAGTVGSAWRATSATMARTNRRADARPWARATARCRSAGCQPCCHASATAATRVCASARSTGSASSPSTGDGSRARASTSRGDGAAPYRADATAASTRDSTDPCAEPDARPAPGAPDRPAPFVRPVLPERPVRRLSPRDVRVRCRICMILSRLPAPATDAGRHTNKRTPPV